MNGQVGALRPIVVTRSAVLTLLSYRPCTKREFTAHMKQNVQYREHPKIDRVCIIVLSGLVALCLALANGGFALNTSVPPSRTFQHLDMVSSTQGWAWSRAQVWVTTDGGVQWRTVTPTFPKTSVPNGLLSFTPISSSSAVVTWELTASGGSTVVAVTTDHGLHWQDTGTIPRMLSPWGLSGNATELQWTSITRGWAIQLGTGNASGYESYWLWSTDNAGKTWHRVHAWNPGLPWAWVTFTSTATGWMAADPGALPMSQLYHTTNRGRSWNAVSWRLPKRTLEFSELSPALPIHTANGEILPVLNRGTGSIMVLQLGSHPHWISQGWTHSPASFRSRFSGAAGLSNVMMTFARIRDGWLVSSDSSALWATTNGGQSWWVINHNARWHHLMALDFISAHNGWAVTTGTPHRVTLWHTTNGGRTWNRLG
jgi:photosystem II stability/assembly factor-like uncharacterized protein